MANVERRDDESESDFRARQKRVEIRDFLDLFPDGVEEMISSPLWAENKGGNLVFNHMHSIRVNSRSGKFTYTISGGKPTHGEAFGDLFADRELAQRGMWERMMWIASGG